MEQRLDLDLGDVYPRGASLRCLTYSAQVALGGGKARNSSLTTQHHVTDCERQYTRARSVYLSNGQT